MERQQSRSRKARREKEEYRGVKISDEKLDRWEEMNEGSGAWVRKVEGN